MFMHAMMTVWAEASPSITRHVISVQPGPENNG